MVAIPLPRVLDWILRIGRRHREPHVASHTLRSGDVLCLDAPTRTGMTLRVTRGIVWLTTTRAGADIILREGDTLTIDRGWPAVVQAVGIGTRSGESSAAESAALSCHYRRETRRMSRAMPSTRVTARSMAASIHAQSLPKAPPRRRVR